MGFFHGGIAHAEPQAQGASQDLQLQPDTAQILPNLRLIAQLWWMIGDEDEMERIMMRALEAARGNA